MDKNIIIFDTCSFLDLITSDEDYKDQLGRFETQAKIGQILIGVSEVTIAEAAKVILKDGSQNPQLVDAFFQHAYARRYPVTAAVSSRAAALIRLYRLGSCDAMILGTALAQLECRTFVTRDGNSLCSKVRGSQQYPAAIRKDFGSSLQPFDQKVVDECKTMNFIEIETVQKPEPVLPAKQPNAPVEQTKISGS